MASVDVIVPCYNYGRFLRECVESVLTQDGVAVRVLIIDDCSSDDSEQVGRSLAAEDPRVEFRRHEKNQGHIATYNEGLEWIAGDYCLLLSADDLITPGALQRAASFLDANASVGFVYGKVIRWKAEEVRPPHMLQAGFETVITPGAAWIRRLCEGGEPLTTSPEIVVRTSLQKQFGGYRTDLPHWADVEMLLRYAARSDIGYLDCEQAYYRIHRENMHNGFRGIREFEQRRMTFRAFFEESNLAIQDGASLKKLALRTLAENACWRAHQAFSQGDRKTSESCLQFARDTDPSIRSSKVYRRIRWKRLLGRTLWSFAAGCRNPIARRRLHSSGQRSDMQ